MNNFSKYLYSIFNEALIYKDLKKAKKFLSLYLLLDFIYCYFIYGTNIADSPYISYTNMIKIIVITCTIIPFFLFYDEKSAGTKYFMASMPIPKKIFIRTKYFLGLFIIAIQFLISYLLIFSMDIITKLAVQQNFYVSNNFVIWDTTLYISTKLIITFFWCSLLYSIIFFTMFLFLDFWKSVIAIFIILCSLFLNLIMFYNFYDIFGFYNIFDNLYYLNPTITVNVFFQYSQQTIPFDKLFSLLPFLLITLTACFVFYKLSLLMYKSYKPESYSKIFRNKFIEIITKILIASDISFVITNILFYSNDFPVYLLMVILFYYILHITFKKLKLGAI